MYGMSKEACLKALRSSCLFVPAVPFLLEIFGFFAFFLSKFIKMCCSFITDKAWQKFLIKFDFLFFVGKNDKSGTEKILCYESAKLFFSSGPQLVLQLWLLQ